MVFEQQQEKNDLQTEEEEWHPLVDFPSQGRGLVVDEGGREDHEQVQATPNRAEPIPWRTPAVTNQLASDTP